MLAQYSVVVSKQGKVEAIFHSESTRLLVASAYIPGTARRNFWEANIALNIETVSVRSLSTQMGFVKAGPLRLGLS